MSDAAPRIRAFFGVALAEPVREALAAFARTLSREPWARAVRWVERGALHLTLRFLGERTQPELDGLTDDAAAIAARHAALRVAFAGALVLPSPRRPRVIAAGLDAPPALAALAGDLEAAAVARGLEPEPRRFRPHVTLGRVRDRIDGALEIDGSAFAEASLDIDALTLFRSELVRRGARYTELARFPLGVPGTARLHGD